MALKQIKNKIRATERTGKVTKAMEAVSAVKMRKSQERALSGRTYAYAALRMLARLSATQDGLNHPLASERSSDGRHLYVVVTSDKGLAGNVNGAVLKLLEQEIAGKDRKMLSFITVGRKASEYLSYRGYKIEKSYINLSDDVQLEEMQEIVSLIEGSFMAGDCDRVSVVYQNFVSTFEQKPSVHQLLPLKEKSLSYIVKGIRPKEGKYAKEEELLYPLYTIEPNPEEVISVLVPRLLEIMVYHALLESKASEHSARMVAMKNATDKAKEMMKSLTIAFNKERQAVITREVSEITGGIEAMAQV